MTLTMVRAYGSFGTANIAQAWTFRAKQPLDPTLRPDVKDP